MTIQGSDVIIDHKDLALN